MLCGVEQGEGSTELACPCHLPACFSGVSAAQLPGCRPLLPGQRPSTALPNTYPGALYGRLLITDAFAEAS